MTSDVLVEQFSAELAAGSGALFIGTGISIPSKVPSWIELLQPLAKVHLGIEVDKTDDLPAIAQYLVNRNGNNRGLLIQHLRREFMKDFAINGYHRAITQANVSLIWTTNYDTLLEEAFRADHMPTNVVATDDLILAWFLITASKS